MALKTRTQDDQGRQIVQVRFPGNPRKTYAYAVSKNIGQMEPGEFGWTEGNKYNPFGSPVAVVAVGSEYPGELAEIICRLSQGYEPQTITVRRYNPAAKVAADMARTIDRDEPYGRG